MKEIEDQFTVTTQSKSSFVTILSWIIIVLTGFSVLGSFINIIMSFFVPIAKLSSSMNLIKFLVNFIFTAIFLIAAIGMLNRKEWARISFIYTVWAFIIIAIGYAIFKVFMPINIPANITIEPTYFMIFFQKVAPVFMVIFVSTLLIWIINRLNSDEVKQEFTAIANKNTPTI